MIERYELDHGRRTKEIRAELTKQFSEEEIADMTERITHWNQYRYLKMRHQLVELRREQYTLRDAYRQTIYSAGSTEYYESPKVDFDAGIEVLPLGIKHKGELQCVIFRPWPQLNPMNTSQEYLKDISDLYW